MSVVIPTWRRPDHLNRCLRALQIQTRLPDEVLVVGRAEDRASLQVVRKQKWDPLTPRWVAVNRPGFVEPVKQGLMAAKGRYMAFIDDDTEPTADWLEYLIAPFEDSRVACVGGRVITPGSSAVVPSDAGCIRWYGRFVANVAEREDLVPVDVDTVRECNWAWHADVLRNLEFDPALDRRHAPLYGLDLTLQAKAIGYRVRYQSRARLLHNPGPREAANARDDLVSNVMLHSRNYTYLALKHLRGVTRVTFVVWWWLIGERGSYGLAKACWDLASFRTTPRLVSESFRGKCLGLRLWLGSRRFAGHHAQAKS